MVRNILFLLISISILTVSCDDCINCEPFTGEPYLRVQFLNSSDSTKKIITIDSVNLIDAKIFRHFQDTTYEFRFPLDMHHDSSQFNIVYHKLDSPLVYMNNKLSVYYNRGFARRSDNYIVVECDITNFTAEFGQEWLKCKDSTNLECISNEAFAKIYN